MNQTVQSSKLCDNPSPLSEQVDRVIETLPEILDEARRRGDDTAPVLMLDDEIAHAPPLSVNGIRSKLTFGLAGARPRDRRDLNHRDYERLWDHLVDSGLQPVIELRGFGPSNLPVAWSFIAATVPPSPVTRDQT